MGVLPNIERIIIKSVPYTFLVIPSKALIAIVFFSVSTRAANQVDCDRKFLMLSFKSETLACARSYTGHCVNAHPRSVPLRTNIGYYTCPQIYSLMYSQRKLGLGPRLRTGQLHFQERGVIVRAHVLIAKSFG